MVDSCSESVPAVELTGKTMTKSSKYLICALVLLFTVHSMAQTCSSLGSSLGQTRFYNSWNDQYPGPFRSGQLLDLSRTAECSGKGVAWNYCFYLGWISSDEVQKALLFVYRKTGETTYSKVDGSEIAVNVYEQYDPQQWHCNRVPLTNPFDVLDGDIIGVCLPDPAYVEPLDIYEDVNGYQLYHKDNNGLLPRCDDVDVLDISDSDWHTHTDHALNVHLEISTAQMSSVLAIMPSSSSPIAMTSSVLFLPTKSSGVLPEASSTLAPQPIISTVMEKEATMESTFFSSLPVISPSSLLVISSAGTPNPTASMVVEKMELKTGPFSPFTSLSLESIVGIVVGGALVLFTLPLCILAAAYCVRKRHREQQYGTSSSSFQEAIVITNLQHRRPSQVSAKGADLRLQQLEELQFVDAQRYIQPAVSAGQLFTQLQELEVNIIPREKIEITQPLGQGKLGLLNRGIWLDSLGMIREVAVKSIEPKSSAEEKIRLLHEAAVMVQFNHSNVIQLYGLVIKNDQFMLVMELAKNGDLHSYLQALKNSGTEQLQLLSPEMMQEFLSFSKDVAIGMYYLSQKRFVHKNIAARNIFLTAAKACKIGNFSVSHARDEVPVRWTAPEVLTSKKYSTASDVWSYGCLLYEIWSAGGVPLEELKHFEVATKVELGYRMSQPPGCPTEMYNLMKQCWEQDPHCRPSFRDVLRTLLQFEDDLQYSMNATSTLLTHSSSRPACTSSPRYDQGKYRRDEADEIEEIYAEIEEYSDEDDSEAEPMYDDIIVKGASHTAEYADDEHVYQDMY